MFNFTYSLLADYNLSFCHTLQEHSLHFDEIVVLINISQFNSLNYSGVLFV